MKRETARFLLRLAASVILLWAIDWHGGVWRGVAMLFAFQSFINLTPRRERIFYE